MRSIIAPETEPGKSEKWRPIHNVCSLLEFKGGGVFVIIGSPCIS